MNKRYKKLSILVILVLHATLTCHALQFQSGAYNLLLVPSADGSQQSASGYNLLDLKGYHIGSPMKSSGYTLEWGFWGDGGGGEFKPGDNGLIRKTRIYRDADDRDSAVKIRFMAADTTITSANVYRLSGQGIEFSRIGNYIKINSNPIAISPNTETEWTDPSLKVADGINAYYRVVPSSVNYPQDDLFGSLNGVPYNSYTVGKVDQFLKKGDYDLYTVPMFATNAQGDVSLAQDIFGTQLKYADLLYNENGLYILKCLDKTWQVRSIQLTQGFWLSRSDVADESDGYITLTGRILTETFSREVVKGLDLYGYPIPVSIAINVNDKTSLGIPPEEGDSILVNQGGLYLYKYLATGWASSFTLGLGKGYWYDNPSDNTRRFDVK